MRRVSTQPTDGCRGRPEVRGPWSWSRGKFARVRLRGRSRRKKERGAAHQEVDGSTPRDRDTAEDLVDDGTSPSSPSSFPGTVARALAHQEAVASDDTLVVLRRQVRASHAAPRCVLVYVRV